MEVLLFICGAAYVLLREYFDPSPPKLLHTLPPTKERNYPLYVYTDGRVKANIEDLVNNIEYHPSESRLTSSLENFTTLRKALEDATESPSLEGKLKD